MTASKLLGRDSAVGALRQAVDAALAGRGGLILITGEAGIGKTALAADVAEYAIALGMELRWATCWSGDGAPPYWPWVQLLRAQQSGGEPSTTAQDAAELLRIMPETAAPATRSPSGLPVDARERFGVFDAVTTLLFGSARVRPQLVVIDDLQWADIPSLLLLNFVARQLAREPLLLVGTFRDDELTGEEQRVHLLAQARGTGRVVALAGLAEADVHDLMASVTGKNPKAEVAAAVFRRTGGNPFFVREVTALLLSRGASTESAAEGTVPDGVREVVRQRLARLPQTSVSMLTIAAVVGREFSSDVLTRVAKVTSDVVALRLESAVQARMLATPPGPAGPFRFTHDLFRETLYSGLIPRERSDLHLRIGRSLQEMQADGSDVPPAELAHHLLLAAVDHSEGVGLAEEAARYGVLAAQEAMHRLAFEDAVGHIQRQIDGLAAAGLLREPVRLRLLLCRAEALRCAGDLASARADCRQAVALARPSRPAEFARAALGVHAVGVESGASRAECAELLDEALDRLPDGDSAVKARVLACLARELFLSGTQEQTRAVTLCAAAVETARRVRDDVVLAECLLAAHDTIWRPGTAERRTNIATEMMSVARRAGDRALEVQALLLLATARLELGDPTAVVDLADFDRLGSQLGQPHFMYLVLSRRAAVATIGGRFAEAEQLMAQAKDIAERIAEPDAWNVHTRLLWRLRSMQGRRAEAEPQLRTMHIPQLQFWFDALIGLALLEGGTRPEGLRMIGAAVRTWPEEQPIGFALMAQWAELGESAAVAGLLENCQQYYAAMLPYTGTVVVSAAAVSMDGAVDHHLGVLAAALGRLDDAVSHLDQACVIHERLSAWPWLAHSRCELATVLAARGWAGDRARVPALLEQVRQAAGEFAMPGLLGRVAVIALTPENVFRRDGDTWQISYAGREIRLRDVKGLGDIAVLLAAEGFSIPASALVSGLSAATDVAATFAADAVLDQQAKLSYRTRLADLDEEINEARRRHDLARIDACTDERAFLVRELSAAVGLGHRDRGLGDDRERARKAVAGRIKDAVTRIAAVHSELGKHLRESISTGTRCAYRPANPTRWRATAGVSTGPDPI